MYYLDLISINDAWIVFRLDKETFPLVPRVWSVCCSVAPSAVDLRLLMLSIELTF